MKVERFPMFTNNIKELHCATLKLLERTGVYVGSDKALDIFTEYSVRVDRAGKRVFPGEKQIEVH